MNEIKLNGPMLAELAQAYVNILAQNSIPRIDNAWDNVLRANCQKLINESIVAFEQTIKEEVKLPLDEQTLKEILRENLGHSLKLFEKECISTQSDEIKDFV